MSEDVKKQVSERLWQIADEIDWLHLSIPQKRNYYESWTSDPEIGGLLADSVGMENVRVYIKDTIMKTYVKAKRLSLIELLNQMSIPCDDVSQTYVKPEGLLCSGTHLYSISTAKQWKNALLSAYERGFEISCLEQNMLFITNHTSGKYIDKSYRDMINAAGLKLGVRIHWVT